MSLLKRLGRYGAIFYGGMEWKFHRFVLPKEGRDCLLGIAAGQHRANPYIRADRDHFSAVIDGEKGRGQ